MSSNPPIARREFVRATLGALAAAPFAAGVFAQDSGALPDNIDFKRLVAANRILAREEIVDAFGHVSIRDPENPRRYVMARSRSPGARRARRPDPVRAGWPLSIRARAHPMASA